MRFDCISQEAWREFSESFPQAVAFLTRKSLEGEFRILQLIREAPFGICNEWERKRLADLEKLLAPVETCKRCDGYGRVEDPEQDGRACMNDDCMMPCPICEGAGSLII